MLTNAQTVPAVADVVATGDRAVAASAPPATCVDPAAMEANRNLVGQVRDYGERARVATESMQAAERRLADRAHLAPSRLVTSREEWSRMARDGIFRLRAPCATWDANPSFVHFQRQLGGGVGRGVSGRSDVRLRAGAVGLSSDELDALTEVYGAVSTKTWAKIKTVCLANEDYRALEADDENPLETDTDRVAACRAAFDGTNREAAMTHVALLRAAGAAIEQARAPEERVLFAVSESPNELFDQMSRVFGHETAARAIDYGVVCLEERVYAIGPRRPPA